MSTIEVLLVDGVVATIATIEKITGESADRVRRAEKLAGVDIPRTLFGERIYTKEALDKVMDCVSEIPRRRAKIKNYCSTCGEKLPDRCTC